MGENCGPESSKETTTATLSVTCVEVFQAQDVLDPLCKIAKERPCANSPGSSDLSGFYCRFAILAILIKLTHQRDFSSNDRLLELLEESCRIKIPTDAIPQGCRYPSLTLLTTWWSSKGFNEQQRLNTILEKIDVHWGTPEHRKHLLTEMDNYRKKGKAGLGKNSTATWNEPSNRRQLRFPCFQAKDQADSVFHALDACRKAYGCTPLAHDYRFRLALETDYHKKVAECSRYTLHIMSNPENSAWMEACVETMSGSRPFSLLRQDNPDNGYQSTVGLCGVIKALNPGQIQLPLRVETGQLFWKADSTPGQYTAAQLRNPTSLQDLIKERCNLGARLELTIAIKLARAALYLEKGPWMRIAWDKQSIQFLRISDQQIPPQPFFLAQISSGNAPRQAQGSNLLSHPDAGLFSLGIMLLELRIGREFESLALWVQAGTSEITPLVAQKIYKEYEDDFSQDFCCAVKACLDINFGIGPLGDRVDDEEFAKRINERIIEPLEREFAYFCRVELSSGAFEDTLQDRQQNILGKPPIAQEFIKEQYADDFMQKQLAVYHKVVNRVQDKTAEGAGTVGDWAHSGESKQALSNLEFPQPGYRIRVAVLDTGIDPHQTLIPECRIKDIRTWLGDANGAHAPEGGDEDGHGTHVAHLVLKVAPDSDLYVARIAREGIPENSRQIAKAVKHAVHEWKVDIITMSFGMAREDEPEFEELRNALNEAYQAKVLLFAAASNGGGSQHRAFPARHSVVFCVHATDGLGNPSDYNPPSEKRQLNLATLGDAVNTEWPSIDSPLARKSGTSFATPIAAAFAAVVLLYARQKLCPKDARRLKWYEKMREVFERSLCSFHGPNDRYDFISLGMIFHGEDQHITSRLEAIARGP